MHQTVFLTHEALRMRMSAADAADHQENKSELPAPVEQALHDMEQRINAQSGRIDDISFMGKCGMALLIFITLCSSFMYGVPRIWTA